MAAQKRFGTDGMRGEVGKTLHPREVSLLGFAAGRYFTRDGSRPHLAVIGKDPRRSGYTLEPAVVSGLASAGMNVRLTGPLSTPGVSVLVRELRADVGVMISASHNLFHDNGIKLFGPDGSKLTDADENAIEQLMDNGWVDGLISPARFGEVERIDEDKGRYIGWVKQTFPRTLSLLGLRIVIDCANGAAYKIAPKVLDELGAEVFTVGTEPNGFNINDNVGSTVPATMVQKVYESRADLGIALDGDADRVIMCDERGNLIDGDKIMAIIATHWYQEKRLTVPTVVATQMSNLAFERHLTSLGMNVVRASVGDRYVLDEMRRTGTNLGGEESGHIICTDYVQTGDGLIAALQVIAAWLSLGNDRPKLSAFAHPYEPLPVVKENFRTTDKQLLERPRVRNAVTAVREAIGSRGRFIVRASGTEPLVRVMLEGETQLPIHRILREFMTHLQ